MKNFFLLFLIFIAFVCFKPKQIKYLPIYVSLADSTTSRAEILLNIKAAFISRKIKMISKNDTEAYIKNEVSPIIEDYIRSGGDITDFNKQKSYLSSHLRYVANVLTLNFSTTSDGYLNDTVKWSNFGVPINFDNTPKNKWHIVILDSTNNNSIQQISQSLVDSIISSDKLFKE